MLPFVVVGELRAGCAHGRRQAENEGILRRFLLKDGVRVLFADDQTTHHYASVFREVPALWLPLEGRRSPDACRPLTGPHYQQYTWAILRSDVSVTLIQRSASPMSAR